jgi:hypothetical protein
MAVDAYPHLRRQVADALQSQARRIAERTAHYIPRTAVIKALDQRIQAASGRLIALQGSPGSGTTALLCYLAATRGYPIWLPEDDAGAGMEALCAQLLALHSLQTPLVPPAAGRDLTTLERLMAEIGARQPAGEPLVMLLDRPPDESDVAMPPPYPTTIPPGVVAVIACSPQKQPAGQLASRVVLPTKGIRVERRLAQAALRLGRSPDSARAIGAAAGGSFLYVRLAIGLLETGMLHAGDLPAGLDALHAAWWQRMDEPERRLAMLLAAVGEPIEVALLGAVAGLDVPGVRRYLLRWRALVEFDERARFYHSSTRALVAQRSGDDLAGAHAAYVELAHARVGGQFERLDASTGYLVRQLARHTALSGAALPASAAPALASRAWIRARERHSGDLSAAAHDLAWELRMATRDGPTIRLVRAAALAGTLALLARTLEPDALAETFLDTLARGGARDETLRRARAMLDQLPEDRNKALVLRQLGEACYAQGMRAPAMRMLSEALDLEAPGLPRSWRDEREEALVTYARAAVAIDATDTALGITARISHAERRGLIETEVVRWLLARGQRTRAEEVAYAIGHQPMHEWAMAEVSVGHVRAGDAARAEIVLSTLKTETAVAWALAELAGDAAHRGDPHAIERVAELANSRLRDRSLALVAQALAAAGQPELALQAAGMAAEREIRARSLIDLALVWTPTRSDDQPATTDGVLAPSSPSPNDAPRDPPLSLNVRELALAHAAGDIAALAADERAPLVAALAAAHAAAGEAATGLALAESLPEGEERDRAQSRVAVARARIGDRPGARRIALAIADDDERNWALDEIARAVAEYGDWSQAFELAEQIGDDQQCARTEADLAIAWARAGHAAAAHARAAQVPIATERLRALAAIAGPLVAQGGKATALATLTQTHDPNARSRYQSALATALADTHELVAAQALARSIARPLDRARALIALARASASAEPQQSHAALGEALRASAALGRRETFTCLGWAADTLAALGGAELLLAAASALDEVDSLWE